MAKILCRTKGNANPKGKPRVYFTCHPEDFEKFFETIVKEILDRQDCAVFYPEPGTQPEDVEDYELRLKEMQLFVVPVTTKLLTQKNRAMDVDVPFAFENRIPVLPLMQESGLDDIFNKKFGDLHPMACANLPYYITSPILSALLESECFDSVTVMVQKEVAQRIAAKPGTADYSAFTIFCNYYAEPEILFDVPAHCFLPQPKVTSAVIQLKVRENRPWDIEDQDVFFRCVKASFAMRRKKLQNGLASGFPELGKAGAGEVIAACGLPENVRGETLDIAQFAAIANEIVRRKQNV